MPSMSTLDLEQKPDGSVVAEEQTGPQDRAGTGDSWVDAGRDDIITLGHVVPAEVFAGRALPVTYDRVRENRRDPTVKLARTLIIAPVLEAGWSVVADDGVEDDVKEFIDDCVSPMHDHYMTKSLLNMSDFGWGAFEKVFEQDESGYVVLRKLKPLLPDITTILVDRKTGAFAGLKNRDVTLDLAESLLVYQDEEGTNWYGEADMLAVDRVMRKYEIIEAAADRYDRKVAGSHWVIHFPRGVTKYNGVETDNSLIARSILNSIESTGKIAIPRQVDQVMQQLNGGGPAEDAWKLELLTDSGGGNTAMLERMRYHDVLKVRCYGAPERAILEGEYGTKAEAETHGDFAVVNINKRRRTAVQMLNWHVVNQLLRLNFGKDYENHVRVVPTPLTDKQLAFIKQVYQAIVTGANGAEEQDAIDMSAVRERVGIPVKASMTEANLPDLTGGNPAEPISLPVAASLSALSRRFKRRREV